MPRLFTLAILLMACFIAGQAFGFGQPLNLTPAEQQALNEARGRVPGEVVFSSLRDGKWRLFRINADGSNLSRLSLGLANYTAPCFIEDGARLIYHSDENGPRQIFLAQPDMSGAVCLSPAGQEERFAGISQNNLMLVEHAASFAYFLRPLQGGPEVRLLLPPELKDLEHKLIIRLAPNGHRLLATLHDNEKMLPSNMYLLTLNPLTGYTHIHRELGPGSDASWRRDSEALVFVRSADFNMSPGNSIWFWEEGGEGQQLSGDLSWNIHTSFALRGAGLVWSKAPLFTREPLTGRYDIWLQRENGSVIRLTQHTAPDLNPTWRAQAGPASHQEVDFIYDAAQASSFRGITVKDKDSPGWQALENAPMVEPGLLLSTPPEVVPPGRYLARFRLKLSAPYDLPPSLPVARLQVVSHDGQKTIATAEILAGNFSGKGYNLFPLYFGLDQLTMELSLRLYTLEADATLRADVLFLQSDAPAPWYAPVLELWRAWTK